MSHQYRTIGDTVYFYFAANDTSGSGGDGATPLFDVREAGALASDPPLLSGTPTLLTNVGYPAGCYEVAVAATVVNGFAANDTFAVFCTLAIDTQNPVGFVGSCTLSAVPSNVVELGNSTQSATDLKDFADAGYDPATNKVEGVKLVDTTTTNTDMRGTDNAALASVATEVRLSELDAATTGKMANQVDIIQTDTTTDLPALISALNDLSSAEVAAELATYDSPTYTELRNFIMVLARSDAAIATDLASTLSAINANLGSGVGSFTNTTDATQAIGDKVALDSTVAKEATLTPKASQTSVDTVTTHLTDLKGTGFVKDTHSMPQCLTATGFSTFDATTDSVIVGTNNDKTNYTLAQAFPPNFANMIITPGGAVDALVQGFLNTLLTEVTAGRIAGNFDTFFENSDAATAKVVDDVGVAGSGLTQQQVRDAMKLAPTVGTPAAGSVDEHLDDILADTNELQADDVPTLIATAQSDLNILTGVDGVVLATSQPNYAPNTTTPPTVAQIADGVWDEPIATHLGVGSTGEALNSAGSSGDPWTTQLPGTYGAGSAGNIIGNLNDFDPTTQQVIVATNNDKNGYTISGVKQTLDQMNDVSAAQVVDEWESQSQLDPTGFHVNVMEVNSLPEDIATESKQDILTANVAALNDLSTADIDARLAAYGAPTLTQLTSAFTEIKGAGWTVADTLEAIQNAVTVVNTSVSALNDISVNDILTTAMTEDYVVGDGAVNIIQAFYEILASLSEHSYSGTQAIFKKRDGVTTAYTGTMDDAVNPTSITRN